MGRVQLPEQDFPGRGHLKAQRPAPGLRPGQTEKAVLAALYHVAPAVAQVEFHHIALIERSARDMREVNLPALSVPGADAVLLPARRLPAQAGGEPEEEKEPLGPAPVLEMYRLDEVQVLPIRFRLEEAGRGLAQGVGPGPGEIAVGGVAAVFPAGGRLPVEPWGRNAQGFLEDAVDEETVRQLFGLAQQLRKGQEALQPPDVGRQPALSSKLELMQNIRLRKAVFISSPTPGPMSPTASATRLRKSVSDQFRRAKPTMRKLTR
jgi:hypothetical protein